MGGVRKKINAKEGRIFRMIIVMCLVTIFGFTITLHAMVNNQYDDGADAKRLGALSERKPEVVNGLLAKVTRHFEHDYDEIRNKFNELHDPSDVTRLREHVKSIRETRYEPIASAAREMPYDVFDCPLHPPKGYPVAFSVLDVVGNWNPDEPTPRPEAGIYQGLCLFQYETDMDKALNYRTAELPFILRDHPDVLPTVERWNTPGYLGQLLGNNQERAEYSENNHFMFWRKNGNRRYKKWKPPTQDVEISFKKWKKHADKFDQQHDNDDNDQQHWYLRLNSCSGKKCDKYGLGWINQEVPWLTEKQSFFIVSPGDHRGINCRFGMKGVIAENHFDGSRNFVSLLGGERRYILAHPNQCQNLCLEPQGHPSARHSAVNWAHPDINTYPPFANAQVNEVVLQAGDSLYLPTYWFHYIISIGTNYQCNARSGVTTENRRHIKTCGF